MKAIPLIFLILFGISFIANSQITIEECQEKARLNYPLLKQYGLIEETTHYNISNANKGYLPQVTFSARATYQSDVTEIPESLGQILSKMTGKEVTFPVMSKDQYQAVLEVSQLIWDGGLIAAQKKAVETGSEVEKQKLEVDLFALNERINQLFFGILLLEQQLKQNDILKSELQTNYDRIKACQQNGVANQSDLDIIKVEQLNSVQREVEIKNSIDAFKEMLSAFTGIKIDENSSFVTPEVSLSFLNEISIKRPELKLFEAQNELYESQVSLFNAGNLPRIGFFLQGGYGKPGLDMFMDGFSPFYIGGIRFSWNINGLYSYKNNINKLEVNKKNVDIMKETFMFNTELKVNQQKSEIDKYNAIIFNDDEIIKLRENIKKAATVKVENGTLTVTDLVREINAESQARKLKSLHEIQLLISIYNLKYTTNN